MKKFNIIPKAFGIFLFAAILFAGSFTQSNQLLAQDTGLITVQSKQSYDQTVDQLKQAVAKGGMMVMSEINQGKMLAMTGIKLNAVSIFVGNPTVGNKLFTANRAVGFVVPIRVNVYEGTDQKTYISYVKPSSQLASLNNKQVDMIVQMLDQKLAMLTGMLSK
ncbi:MAG: DUF302 domain-containing protein [Bacteroidetes bacterium]|nr:DUF302 domain-containing protein [Bacteroidota bacterium]